MDWEQIEILKKHSFQVNKWINHTEVFFLANDDFKKIANKSIIALYRNGKINKLMNHTGGGK